MNKEMESLAWNRFIPEVYELKIHMWEDFLNSCSSSVLRGRFWLSYEKHNLFKSPLTYSRTPHLTVVPHGGSTAQTVRRS